MDEHLNTMEHMTIRVDELLKKLRDNRDKHREVFVEAQKGYRKAVIKELDTMLTEAASGGKIRRSVEMPEPQDHTEEYERAILMLTMCTGEEIVISQLDFHNLVMDNWGWKREWTATNNVYRVTS